MQGTFPNILIESFYPTMETVWAIISWKLIIFIWESRFFFSILLFCLFILYLYLLWNKFTLNIEGSILDSTSNTTNSGSIVWVRIAVTKLDQVVPAQSQFDINWFRVSLFLLFLLFLFILSFFFPWLLRQLTEPALNRKKHGSKFTHG